MSNKNNVALVYNNSNKNEEPGVMVVQIVPGPLTMLQVHNFIYKTQMVEFSGKTITGSYLDEFPITCEEIEGCLTNPKGYMFRDDSWSCYYILPNIPSTTACFQNTVHPPDAF